MKLPRDWSKSAPTLRNWSERMEQMSHPRLRDEFICNYSSDALTGTMYRPRVTWKCVGFRAIS